MSSAPSCNKTAEPVRGSQNAQAELKWNISTKESKTTQRSDSQDRAINSVAILIFDDQDRLENSYFENGVTQGKLSGIIRTSMGIKTILAFANGSDDFRSNLKNISYLDEINDLTSSLVDDNVTGSFLMAGKMEGVDVNSPSFDLNIQVSRLVARIEIHKITHAISEETDNVTAGQRFMVKGIYLINVPGDLNFGDANPELWYNQLKCNNENPSIFADHGIDFVLEKNESYETPHYFYCYPNPCTNAACTDGVWCPRPTRLVLECWIGEDGEENISYYSFEMPDIRKNPDVEKLSSNMTYSITSCRITRRGSDNPWEDIPVGSISISISVKDWESGASYEYTI